MLFIVARPFRTATLVAKTSAAQTPTCRDLRESLGDPPRVVGVGALRPDARTQVLAASLAPADDDERRVEAHARRL